MAVADFLSRKQKRRAFMSHHTQSSVADSITSNDSIKTKKIPVEVYSRVVGYYRPVNQWNPGKQEEFAQRIEYSLPSVCNAVAKPSDNTADV
jgi:hypothetical protein